MPPAAQRRSFVLVAAIAAAVISVILFERPGEEFLLSAPSWMAVAVALVAASLLP